MNAIFHLPEFVDYEECYRRIFILKDLCPSIFIPNTEIGSIYGNFHNCIWNGGTFSMKPELLPAPEIERIVYFYNFNLDIPLCFTFTNPMLEKEDCFDRYSNLIIKIGETGKNIIRVTSPILESYLREKYPNYKYSSSVIATENQAYGDLQKYDNVVIRRIFNNNWLFLDNVDKKEREKIEFICDEPCPADCSNMFNHYNKYADYALSFFSNDKRIGTNCIDSNPTHIMFPRFFAEQNKWYISRELIDKEYVPRGYVNFKLTGRWNSCGILYGLMKYLIKPEFVSDVIYRCFVTSKQDFDYLVNLLYNIEKEKEKANDA